MDQPTATEYCETLLRHFENDLTEWEDHFVRDVQLQLKDHIPPSVKQAGVLDRMMAKYADRRGQITRGEWDTDDE